MTVAYSTEQVTATAHEDYRAVSGTLTFKAGQTEQTIDVPLIDNLHNDGGETFRLALTKPSGATLERARATGTIDNDDPMPFARLGRFGRTAGDHAVQAVQARMSDASRPIPESHVTIGGRRVDWRVLNRFTTPRRGLTGPGELNDPETPEGAPPRLDPRLADESAWRRMDRLKTEALAGSLAGGGLAGGGPAGSNLAGERPAHGGHPRAVPSRRCPRTGA